MFKLSPDYVSLNTEITFTSTEDHMILKLITLIEVERVLKGVKDSALEIDDVSCNLLLNLPTQFKYTLASAFN